MSEKRIADIPGTELRAIDDIAIDRYGFPFSDMLFTESVAAEVTPSVFEQLGSSAIHLDTISSHHARSYELGSAQNITAVWADRHGNRYTSLSYKGNNLTTTEHVIESATAPSGLIVFGLQEDDALLRIFKSSDLLRRLKIPTEWLVGLVEPKVLPTSDNTLVTQADFKKQLLSNILDQGDVDFALKVSKAISPMTFYVTARCMEINDRPTDFLTDFTDADVRSRLSKIFTVYNMNHANQPDFHALNVDDPDDCIEYFTDILPRVKATNLAKLHNAGLVHKFPVLGNTTALGGVIDLDSVHGAPLGIGDEPITFDDIRNDLAMAFDEDRETYVDLYYHLKANATVLGDQGISSFDLVKKPFFEAYFAASEKDYSFADKLRLIRSAVHVPNTQVLNRLFFDHVQEMVKQEVPDITEVQDYIKDHVQELRAGKIPAIGQEYIFKAFDRLRTEEGEKIFTDQRFTINILIEAFFMIQDEIHQDILNDGIAKDAGSPLELLTESLGLDSNKDKDVLGMLYIALMPSLKSLLVQDPSSDELHEHVLKLQSTYLSAFEQILSSGTSAIRFEPETDAVTVSEASFKFLDYQCLSKVPMAAFENELSQELPDVKAVVHRLKSGEQIDPLFADMPVFQYISDGSSILDYRYINTVTRKYELKVFPSPDATYIARVYYCTEDEVCNIVVQEVEPEEDN